MVSILEIEGIIDFLDQSNTDTIQFKTVLARIQEMYLICSAQESIIKFFINEPYDLVKIFIDNYNLYHNSPIQTILNFQFGKCINYEKIDFQFPNEKLNINAANLTPDLKDLYLKYKKNQSFL